MKLCFAFLQHPIKYEMIFCIFTAPEKDEMVFCIFTVAKKIKVFSPFYFLSSLLAASVLRPRNNIPIRIFLLPEVNGIKHFIFVADVVK
jgi:hypothetical protein